MLALAIWHSWIGWKSSDLAAESLTSTLTKTLEFQTDTTFRAIDNLLLEASQRIDPDHWPDPVLVQWFQSRLVAFPEARNLIVATHTGQSAGPGLSSSGMVGQSINVSDRQHFRMHRAGQDLGAMLIGDPIIDRLDGRQIIPLSRAVMDAQGKFKGMVAVGIDPQFLVKALESLLIENAGGISIIRRDGIFLARLPDQYGSFGRSVAASDLFTKFLANSSSGIARFVSVADGNAKIVAYRTLERYPLVATVGITEKTAFSRFWVETTWLAITVIILAGALYWFAASSDRREHYRSLLATRLEEQSTALERQVAQRTSHLVELQAESEKKARQLAASNADLEQFAYIASHDLQEPLRTVTSFVQLLQHRYEGKLDTDANEYIAYAVDGAKRMHELILDLLSYSRVSTQGDDFISCDLNRIVAEAQANLEVSISESAALIEVGPLPTVDGDHRQLVSLFQNLISNAIKYRKVNLAPKLRIQAIPDGKEWMFQVSDNGIGIEPEYRERIFVIFQRLHAAGTYEGTGIGLAICKRIVDRHGGRIWVESETGKGSTFNFTLSGLPPLS